MDIFALDLLTISSQARLWLTILVCFCPTTLKKNDKIILNHAKNWWTADMYPDLSDQTQFKLNKINEIKDYFITKSWERETMSKGLSKYIAALNYINQPLSIDKGVSIASFVCAVVALVE